jgi:hypothetical protein
VPIRRRVLPTSCSNAVWRAVMFTSAAICAAAACGGSPGSSSGDGSSANSTSSGGADASQTGSSGSSSGSGSGSSSGSARGTDASSGGGPNADGGDTGALDAAEVFADARSADAGRMQAVYMTFYGWPDNSPPGNAIAYPMSGGFPTIHDAAGGTGTYADPITFATDQAEFPVGTVLYAAVIDKYLIMEDDCVECDSDWSSSMKWHIDVWMNSNATANANAVEACEDQWTQNSTFVEVSPPPSRQVTTPPLFDTTDNTCRTSP